MRPPHMLWLRSACDDGQLDEHEHFAPGHDMTDAQPLVMDMTQHDCAWCDPL